MDIDVHGQQEIVRDCRHREGTAQVMQRSGRLLALCVCEREDALGDAEWLCLHFPPGEVSCVQGAEAAG